MIFLSELGFHVQINLDNPFKFNMGDWRTLHLFDKKKYINQVVPKVRNIETYLNDFLTERHTRWLNGFLISKEEIINQTKKLVSELDEELNCHPELIKLNIVSNKNFDNYYSHKDEFIRNWQHAIEFFEYIIIETIFSSVADFNPHFLLGKRRFEGSIEVKEKSISLELVSKITSQNESSILDLIDGGIINWLDEEEVKLLYWDRDNIKPSSIDCVDYIIEFKEFLKYASEKNLGIISLRNPREYELAKLQLKENELVKNIVELNFKSITTTNT